MIFGPEAQPEILFRDARERARHESHAEIALLSRLIRDELLALPGQDPAGQGRIRVWILAAQAARRAHRRLLAAASHPAATHAAPQAEHLAPSPDSPPQAAAA